MNKKIIFIGILLFVALLAVVFVWKKDLKQKSNLTAKPTAAITSTPTPTVTIDSLVGTASALEQIDTSNWKTYTAAGLPDGYYSYKYPSGFNPQRMSFYDNNAKTELSKQDGIFGISLMNGAEGIYPQYDQIEKKYLVIDGTKVPEYVYTYKGTVQTAFIFLKSDKYLGIYSPEGDAAFNKTDYSAIYINIQPEGYKNGAKYLLLGEKITSTIKFLK